MGASIFNEMEIDAIGEIMNISLGASATAVSTLLGAVVNITTPVATVQTRDEFEFKEMDPAVGVEISYVEGLDGKNIMMFSRNDVRIIVGMMMGMEIPEDEFEMDEINASAIREVMNQMMGASATALSEFLGTTVNISTPVSYEIPDEKTFKDQNFDGDKPQVVVRFNLEIEGKLSSAFLNIMSVGLVKKLLAPFAEQFGLPTDSDAYDYETPEIVTGVPLSEITDEDRAAVGDLVHRPMDQSSTDALLRGMQQEEAPKESSKPLDQDAVNALLASMGAGGAAPEPAPAAEDDTDALAQAIFKDTKRTLNQEEMDELFASLKAQAESESDPEPEPAPAPVEEVMPAPAPASAESSSGSGMPLSQAQIDAMKASAAPQDNAAPSGAPQPAAQIPEPQVIPQGAPQGSAQAAQQMGQAAAAPQAMAPYPMAYAQPDPLMVQLLSQMQQSQAQMMSQMQQSQNQMIELIRDMRAEKQQPPVQEEKKKDGSLIKPLNSREFDGDNGSEGENEDNREMLMKVPLEISVEIGRTRKLVKDILEFTQGSLVVLDKMAGEQADLYVNGECIARGDIVVVEDNFGIRITEILKKDINEESL